VPVCLCVCVRERERERERERGGKEDLLQFRKDEKLFVKKGCSAIGSNNCKVARYFYKAFGFISTCYAFKASFNLSRTVHLSP